MNLKQKIADIIIQDIKCLDILFLNEYARENRDLISSLYVLKCLQDDQIENALKISVIKKAVEEYEFLKRSRLNFAEETLHPEYLVYALENDKFSLRQIRKIPFKNKSIETFIQQYRDESLLANLKKRFLNPPALKKSID